MALLCYLHGGMMVSEIERLHKENIALGAVVPYFKIAYVTKNKEKSEQFR